MKGLRVITTMSSGRPGDSGGWDRLDGVGFLGQLGLGIHLDWESNDLTMTGDLDSLDWESTSLRVGGGDTR